MLTIAIDCGDQLRKGHTALTGDLLQTVPELVFEADARLVACNDNRALRNRRLHGFSPANQASVLYDRMALRTRKPPGLVPPGERLSRDWEPRAQRDSYWRSLTCRSQQAGRACAVLRGLEIHRVSVDAAAHHVGSDWSLNLLRSLNDDQPRAATVSLSGPLG